MKTKDDLIMKQINLLCKNFDSRSDSQNLNDFLDVFEKLYPDWVEMYNERDEQTYGDISDEIDEMLITKLPENTSISKFKVVEEEKESLNKKLEKKVRLLHISNKLAHGITFAIKEYLYYFANQEISGGKLDLENIMKFERDIDGNMASKIDEKFVSDFMINFPFDLDLSNEDVRNYFTTYTSADKSITGITSKIRDTRKRIAEIEAQITKIQEDDGVTIVDKEMLKKYLEKLRLKIRLESLDSLDAKDVSTLSGLCADRVALSNYIPEELIEEAENLQLSIYDLYDQSDLLKIQKKDAASRAEGVLGESVDVAFSKLSRLRLKYDLSVDSIYGLSTLGFGEAKKAYDNCMDIKNRMVVNIHEFIQDNNMRYISYGVASEIENKADDAEKNVFLVDLPGYSQVSVHFMPGIIQSELDGKEQIPEYNMVLSNDGRREQVVLVNENTRAFRFFRRKVSDDYTIDKKMGFDTIPRLTLNKKAGLRKLYSILSLDIGDDIDEKEFWNKRVGKGKSYEEFTEKQKIAAGKKVLEARDRRKAARHQLGVMLGLSQDLLQVLYDYEGKDFNLSCRSEVEKLGTVKERNEVRIKKVFDTLLGRDKKQNQSKTYPNRGKNVTRNKDTGDAPGFGE